MHVTAKPKLYLRGAASPPMPTLMLPAPLSTATTGPVALADPRMGVRASLLPLRLFNKTCHRCIVMIVGRYRGRVRNRFKGLAPATICNTAHFNVKSISWLVHLSLALARSQSTHNDGR